MATIVKYTDRERPANQYPAQIVSPLRSSPCCFSDMEDVGTPIQDARWTFSYRRCRQCGFTIRVILREIVDEALLVDLRQHLAKAFTRIKLD